MRRRDGVVIPPKRIGRPSLYRDEYPKRAYEYALLGATDAQICGFFGVAGSTFEDWKIRHPALPESLKNGRADADGKVAKSLYQRAIGYNRHTVKIFMHDGVPIHVPIVEHCPPETTAMIFWLKNRQPHLWRDRKELTGADGGPVKIQRIESRVIDADFTDITDAVVAGNQRVATQRNPGADHPKSLPATIATRPV